MLNEAAGQTLLAYQVDEPHEGHSVVIFASSGAEARRRGANHFDMEFAEVDSCRRAQHFDAYAPGPVPAIALLEAGWWFDCASCGERVSLERDDEDGDTAGEPCAAGEHVYCSPGCRGRHFAYLRGRAAAEHAMVELVTTRYPAAKILRVHVYADRLEAVEPDEPLRSSATFALPGLAHPATYHFGRSSLFVSQVDVEAFKALYGPRAA